MRCQGDATDFSCRCDYWGSTHIEYPAPGEANRELIPRPGGVVVTGECDPEEDEWEFDLHYFVTADGPAETRRVVDFESITCYPLLPA